MNETHNGVDLAGVQRFFDSMPTQSRIVAFNYPRSFGFAVEYAEKGYGFGQLVFSVNKRTGEVTFDDDGTRMARCGRIVARCAGTVVTTPQPATAPSTPSSAVEPGTSTPSED